MLARLGSPLTFVPQGGALQNDAQYTVTAAANGSDLTATMALNAPCNSDVYVTLASPGGATMQNVNLTLVPLVNCMIPVDAGTGGGSGGDAGTGGGGGNTGTTTLPSVGPGSTAQQPQVKTGCGCSSPADFAAPLMALVLMLGRRRRRS
jgi:MYXO-CTERM domain-containing protein